MNQLFKINDLRKSANFFSINREQKNKKKINERVLLYDSDDQWNAYFDVWKNQCIRPNCASLKHSWFTVHGPRPQTDNEKKLYAHTKTATLNMYR